MTRRDDQGLTYLATGDESRRLDNHVIDTLGLPGRVLMELAGQGAARAIRERTGDRPGKALILCGGGNNAGDGYVVARALSDAGWTTWCLSTTNADRLAGDAAANRHLYETLGGDVRPVPTDTSPEAPDLLDGATVVVDALFGTGLSRPIEGAIAGLIAAVNGAKNVLRVALDIPSGVCATSGHTAGVAFSAHLTTSFGLPKLGLMQHPGATLAGEMVTVPIGLPRPALLAADLQWRHLDALAVARILPGRPSTGHKGTFGHVGVVGGFAGMGGAAILAAHGALRSGCGLVTWNGPESPDQVARPAELMFHGISAGMDTRSDVLAVGPGLGRGPDSAHALHMALEAGRPLVLDADALNTLAERSDKGADTWPRCSVLTPHPAEAARLLGVSTEAVQSDRPQALRDLVALTEAVVVLKGARSLVGAPETPGVVIPGDAPALAVAGSGDVLTGVISGLMAQGLSAFDAALGGCWLHATAGRRLGEGHASRGVRASEVADALPMLIDELEQGWFA